MIALVVDTVSIHTLTNFTTNIALPAPALNMLGLDVPSKVCCVLGGIFTVSTRMATILKSGHLQPNGSHYIV